METSSWSKRSHYELARRLGVTLHSADELADLATDVHLGYVPPLHEQRCRNVIIPYARLPGPALANKFCSEEERLENTPWLAAPGCLPPLSCSRTPYISCTAAVSKSEFAGTTRTLEVRSARPSDNLVAL